MKREVKSFFPYFWAISSRKILHHPSSFDPWIFHLKKQSCSYDTICTKLRKSTMFAEGSDLWVLPGKRQLCLTKKALPTIEARFYHSWRTNGSHPPHKIYRMGNITHSDPHSSSSNWPLLVAYPESTYKQSVTLGTLSFHNSLNKSSLFSLDKCLLSSL